MAEWFRASGNRGIIANKLIKLRRASLRAILGDIRQTLLLPEEVPVIPFGREGPGRDEVLDLIFRARRWKGRGINGFFRRFWRQAATAATRSIPALFIGIVLIIVARILGRGRTAHSCAVVLRLFPCMLAIFRCAGVRMKVHEMVASGIEQDSRCNKAVLPTVKTHTAISRKPGVVA